jgi:hypothetical protein
MSQMGERRLTGARALALALIAGLALACATATGASAALDPQDALTYIPNGFVHNTHSAEEVGEILAALDSYGIGQAILPMPRLKRDGTMKVPRKESRMIPLWVSRVAAYDAAHGADEQLVGVFDGRVKGASLNLEDPAVRANVVAAIEAMLGQGIGAVQLDFEPYPTSPGFLSLLEEIDAAFARLGFHGRLSVCAPANVSRWSAPYLRSVTDLISQVDPLFYDSELTTSSAYESWVREGLAYYSANTTPATMIVPVIPSYGTNRWHRPAVENIATATTALEEALGAGSRVQGAGIFWWWGFYYEEEGAYDPRADQTSWSSTLALPFSP